MLPRAMTLLFQQPQAVIFFITPARFFTYRSQYARLCVLSGIPSSFASLKRWLPTKLQLLLDHFMS
jgi:hypothetical protein